MSIELNNPTRCPECGSENVNPKQCNGVETVDGQDWWYGSFDCRACGLRFEGAMLEENETTTVTYDSEHVPDEAWDLIEEEGHHPDAVKAFMYCNHLTIDVVEDDHVAVEVEWDDVRDNFEEAYQGQFGSDADFAAALADDMGVVPQDYSWPTSYIDWDRAARDLMMDYYEEGGHYFRS